MAINVKKTIFITHILFILLKINAFNAKYLFITPRDISTFTCYDSRLASKRSQCFDCLQKSTKHVKIYKIIIKRKDTIMCFW